MYSVNPNIPMPSNIELPNPILFVENLPDNANMMMVTAMFKQYVVGDVRGGGGGWELSIYLVGLLSLF